MEAKLIANSHIIQATSSTVEFMKAEVSTMLSRMGAAQLRCEIAS